ncbi:MAG TPA: cytochrome P450 [Ktedonobacteraceae bacterium]
MAHSYRETDNYTGQSTYSHILLPTYQINPYPLYQELREERSMHWDEALATWVFMSYQDVQTILNDLRFSNMLLSIETIFPPELWEKYQRVFQVLNQVPCLNDVPEHAPLRKDFIYSFRLQDPHGHYVQLQAFADHLLEACIEKRQVDIMQEFAYPLAFKLMEVLLGFPLEDRPQILLWGNALATLIDGCPPSHSALIEALDGALACYDFFEQHLKRSHFCQQEETSINDLVLAHCTTILASIPATACQIGNSLCALMKYPNQFHQLRLDAPLPASVFQELLRYDTSTQTTSRQATTDAEIAGQLIKADQAVMLCLGSANHDPQQFDHPDDLDFGRHNSHPMTFGEGLHVCPGIQAVRLVMECFLGSLRHLSQPPVLLEAAWACAKVIRGPKTLRVSLKA